MGSMVHFSPSHQPVQRAYCNWQQNTNNVPEKETSYTSNLNPYGPPSSAKEDYPSHIPVVKTKGSDTKTESVSITVYHFWHASDAKKGEAKSS